MKSYLLLLLILITNAGFSQTTKTKRVILIGVDGMSPDGINNANTPYMDALVNGGSSTFTARAVLPTSSSPNWASMIMGAGPDQHGVTSNSWEPNKQTIKLECTGKKGNGKNSEMWPTIYGLLREQKTNSKIFCFHDWWDYGRLVEPGVCDKKKGPGLYGLIFQKGNKRAINRAKRIVKKKDFDFIFVHLDHVDHAGHHDGHGTPEYYKAVEYADILIGEVIQTVKDAGIEEETIIMVTADHGGIGKGHGGNTPEEVNIPWILKGPDISPGHKVNDEVNTYDTAHTLARIFALETPACWIGKCIDEIFID